MPTRPRLTLLVAAIAAAGLVGAGCSEQSAALRVGDTVVSQSDFEDELDAFAELQGRETVTGDLAGSYTQEFVAAALGQRIELILAGQMFDEQGLELTDADIADFTDQAGDQLDGVPGDLRRSLIEDVARRTRLIDELGEEEYGRALLEAVDATDIEVSTHYGSWDPDQRTIEPPEGPAGSEPSQGPGDTRSGGG
ncbi:MAG: hypothetical protein ACRD07_19495 [Acidimicrobiales bacterium]